MVTRSTSERSYPAGQPVGWSDVDTSHDRYIRVQGGYGVFGENGGDIEAISDYGRPLAFVQGLAFACFISLTLDTKAVPGSGVRVSESIIFASSSDSLRVHPDDVYASSLAQGTVPAEKLQSTIALPRFMPQLRDKLKGSDPTSEAYEAVYYTANRVAAYAAREPNLGDAIFVPDAAMRSITVAKRDAMEPLVNIADLARDEARALAEESAIRGQTLASNRKLFSVGFEKIPGIVSNPRFSYGAGVVSDLDDLIRASRTAQETERRLAESAQDTFDELCAIRAALTALTVAEHAAAETVA